MSTLSVTEVAVKDGTNMRLHVVKPDKPNGAGIMVFQEAFGVNDHIRDVATRFADLGLLAVSPELFHRGGTDVTMAYDDLPAVMKFMGEHVTRDGLIADCEATAAWMMQNGVAAGRLASVGYCMGGRVSFTANAVVPLAAAIGYYGGLAPASLDLAPKQHGPLLLFWGGLDKNITTESTRAAADALDAAKKDFTEVRFAQADHGFFCDGRPAVYNADAARISWAMTKEFLAVHKVL
jgi:carboxymethylenebutenolidase